MSKSAQQNPGIQIENANALPDHFKLTLYVTGATPNSLRAISNIKSICEKHLKGKYALEIIDVYENRSVAVTEQLIALPMLIKSNPSPVKRLVGDLSNTAKVLESLGIQI